MGPYSSREVIRALERLGFERMSQRGSHLKLRRRMQDRTRIVIVKVGAREIPAGTLASILRQAGLGRTELDAAVKE